MNDKPEITMPASRRINMSPHEEALMQQHLRDENLPEAVMPACPINKVLKGQKALVTGANSGIGEPDDIGRTAVWLASDDSDYIHGASIFVDGGMTLYPGFETGG